MTLGSVDDEIVSSPGLVDVSKVVGVKVEVVAVGLLRGIVSQSVGKLSMKENISDFRAV